MEEVFGKDGSDIGRFSLSESTSKEPDGVGAEDCLRKLRTVDSENTPLLPQRVKSGSVSDFALLTSAVRNHARSAFKRFSHPLPLAYPPRRSRRKWRQKSDWSDVIPKNFYKVKFCHEYGETFFFTHFSLSLKH